jgi:SWI/SNF-related matrix-associated actin-dependent regulator 1 of chromatin subfamily A
MSYELASKRAQDLEDLNFQICIADEAHYLKSRDAKRTKKLMPILSKAKRCILLTGTPILSHPVELYNLLKVLRPEVMTSFTQYT